MNRILRTITTLDQHFDEIANGGDCYRPVNCPHCQATGLWHHGCYHRKADRSAARRNPVAILRFFCKACLRTCSRLPACIAPGAGMTGPRSKSYCCCCWQASPCTRVAARPVALDQRCAGGGTGCRPAVRNSVSSFVADCQGWDVCQNPTSGLRCSAACPWRVS